jgi:hypothetical protein
LFQVAVLFCSDDILKESEHDVYCLDPMVDNDFAGLETQR